MRSETCRIERSDTSLFYHVSTGNARCAEIVYKMKDWIGNNSPLADYLEEYFKEKYYNVYQEIDNRHLCFNYVVVIELLDISDLDNIIRDIINE